MINEMNDNIEVTRFEHLTPERNSRKSAHVAQGKFATLDVDERGSSDIDERGD